MPTMQEIAEDVLEKCDDIREPLDRIMVIASFLRDGIRITEDVFTAEQINKMRTAYESLRTNLESKVSELPILS